MKIKIAVLLLGVLLLGGCTSYKNYYKLDKNYLARRQMESRFFEAQEEESLLIASAQVLQDLGFTLDESETKLGLITAYKDREASSDAEKTAIIVLAALGGTVAVYDTEQKIYVTLVSTPSKTRNGYVVRVEFARVIWNSLNESRVEKIQEKEIYKDFFEKLSGSIFLTAHNI